MNNTQLLSIVEIIKWQGIKNDDTKKVTGGYLWLKFHADAKIKNRNPNMINARVDEYKKGQQIGFSVGNVSSRKEAIQKFFIDHQLVH